MPVLHMSQNLVNDNIPVANRAYLIITETMQGLDTLNSEHVHAKYTLMVGATIDDHNHNILTNQSSNEVGTDQVPCWASPFHPLCVLQLTII